jgi:NADPH2:quinone reductase
MKAIEIEATGGPEVLKAKETAKPSLKAGEALVRLHAAGLNFIDIYIRKGFYKRPLPLVLGMEGAGVIEEIRDDEGTGLMEGDRVAWAGELGAYAEYAAVKASRLIPLPEDVSFEEGAAFPLQGMTAHYLVHAFYPVGKGTTVLIHAAAGGVGLLAVQWAKHLGARVLGTVSTDEKAQIARRAGADELILYTQEDFAEAVKRLTGGRGADYIIDGVGKSTFTKDLEAVRMRGHVCLFGSASGPAEPMEPMALMPRALTVSGGMLWAFTADREELLMRANDVLEGMREGWLKLNVSTVLPLEQAAEAHALLEGRKTTGKVILKIGA